MSTKLEKAIAKVFDVLQSDMRGLTASERSQAFDNLKIEFNKKIDDLKKFQCEVEYGQHVEGLYNINSREAYLYDGGWKFRC